MPLKCQFCQEESVVEEDVGDGREQLICVECGAVATSASQLPKVCKPASQIYFFQDKTKFCFIIL